MANRALEGARRKGYEARKAGTPKSLCPYRDLRAGRHEQIPTWSRAFRNAWFQGWEKADREIREGI